MNQDKRMVNIRVFLIIVLCLVSIKGFTQVLYKNETRLKSIKTVQFFRDGWSMSNPVIELNSDVQLILSFDELNSEANEYFYTIRHCSANWEESSLHPTDFIEGFEEQVVHDYQYSLNTNIGYINYQIAIPNEDIRLKLSGNYVLLVYRNNDVNDIVISRRFSVVEPLVGVEAVVKRATFDPYKGGNHEVDFTIHHERINLRSPIDEIEVHVVQNDRFDNAICDLKPQYIRDNALIYDYGEENVFPAGNEFRYFDVRNEGRLTERVADISFHDPYYHFTLLPDEIRAGKRFFGYEEMNGRFAVERYNKADPFTEADYVMVHFALPMEQPLLSGAVHVFGSLTDWTCDESNKMTYNFERKTYEASLLVKQGFYNYQYAFVTNGARVYNTQNLEGSYFETENDYQIFVYYKPVNSRHEMLVGYVNVNSQRR
ncbi:DUF5103 domain-containing protein [Puteibacter caeruleilacunae]|nr:DUF5103 domain-containing protein [Puteibacter caeruleilacunae]